MQNVKAAKKKKILTTNELNESGKKKDASNLESQISSFLETAKNATSKVNLDMKMAHGEILSETNIVLAKIEFNELKHTRNFLIKPNS